MVFYTLYMAPLPEAPRWTHSSDLFLPPQTLTAIEVPGFLRFVFSDIAVRPERLPLRECAAVCRYLRRLSDFGEPEELRNAGPEARLTYRTSPQGRQDRGAMVNLHRIAEGSPVTLRNLRTKRQGDGLAFLRTSSPNVSEQSVH